MAEVWSLRIKREPKISLCYIGAYMKVTSGYLSNVQHWGIIKNGNHQTETT